MSTENIFMLAFSFVTIGLILGGTLFYKERFTAKPKLKIWIGEPMGDNHNCYLFRADNAVTERLKQIKGIERVFNDMFVIDMRYRASDVLKEIRESI